MNENLIQISNGKVVGDSAFFIAADHLLDQEIQRLCDYTGSLDKDPVRKKENMAEYKCAKYRYAVVSLIHSILYNNNRGRKTRNLEQTHYLFPPYDEMFKKNAENLAIYETVPLLQKPDFSLYSVMLFVADKELAKLEAKRPKASAWEETELDVRASGLQFAKECLREAWQTRGKE